MLHYAGEHRSTPCSPHTRRAPECSLVARRAPLESTPAPGPPLVLTRDESVWEGSDTKFVGTPETWAMKGLEIASVLARHRVIITELSPGEIRYATAGRIVLPPLPIPPDQWVVWDQGTVSLVSAERFLP